MGYVLNAKSECSILYPREKVCGSYQLFGWIYKKGGCSLSCLEQIFPGDMTEVFLGTGSENREEGKGCTVSWIVRTERWRVKSVTSTVSSNSHIHVCRLHVCKQGKTQLKFQKTIVPAFIQLVFTEDLQY